MKSLSRPPTAAVVIAVVALSTVALLPSAEAEVQHWNYTTCYVADLLLCTMYHCWYDTETEEGDCRVEDQCLVRQGNQCGQFATQ